MSSLTDPGRRRLLSTVVTAGAALALSACGAKEEKAAKGEEGISPAEDLMREHGVLKRVLLVYREAAARLAGQGDVPADPLRDAASLIQTFIEGYHEKLEEEHLFPRFRKANVLVDLVGVLQAQHDAGRRLTQATLGLTTAAALRDADSRRRLAAALTAFVRMYEPHEAREDTVLFPALRRVVSAREVDALGEEFERKERELLGEDGFEESVVRIAVIEKAFGLDDLATFTAKG